MHCNNTATALFMKHYSDDERSIVLSCMGRERGTDEAQQAITIEHLISSYEMTCPSYLVYND